MPDSIPIFVNLPGLFAVSQITLAGYFEAILKESSRKEYAGYLYYQTRYQCAKINFLCILAGFITLWSEGKLNSHHQTYLWLHFYYLKIIGILILAYLCFHEIFVSYFKAISWKFEGIEQHDNFQSEIIDQ